MQVNKETATKIISYTNKLTDKWNGSNNRDKLRVMVDPNARYSFYRFAAEHNLLEDARERLDDISIPCPFHEDAAPSCNLNDRIHKYHCFSCDRGGNIFSLMAEWDRTIVGLNVSYYQKINECLINDKEMQAAIGAQSIFELEDTFSFEDSLKRFRPKLNQEDMPKSYPELATLIQKKGCTVGEIKYFILLMQAGESPSDIYKEIFKKEQKVTKSKEEYDLNTMLMFEDK